MAGWEQFRINRSVKLKETDWTQMSDSPLPESKRLEFANYRQALREIPQQTENPDDVIWPEKPVI